MDKQKNSVRIEQPIGKESYTVNYRHPMMKDKTGKTGRKVHRGIGRQNPDNIPFLRDWMNELIHNSVWHDASMRDEAISKGCPTIIADAFYEPLKMIMDISDYLNDNEQVKYNLYVSETAKYLSKLATRKYGKDLGHTYASTIVSDFCGDVTQKMELIRNDYAVNAELIKKFEKRFIGCDKVEVSSLNVYDTLEELAYYKYEVFMGDKGIDKLFTEFVDSLRLAIEDEDNLGYHIDTCWELLARMNVMEYKKLHVPDIIIDVLSYLWENNCLREWEKARLSNGS